MLIKSLVYEQMMAETITKVIYLTN